LQQNVGESVGAKVGAKLGAWVGAKLGACVGAKEGACVGAKLGALVGTTVGLRAVFFLLFVLILCFALLFQTTSECDDRDYETW